MKIKNNTVVITGGASGLGEATARGFAAAGANVCIFDMNLKRAKTVAADINGVALACNVAEENSVIEAISAAEAAHGIARIVVNCAGIGQSEKVISGGMPMNFEHHKKVIDVHLNGTFNIIRLTAAKMITMDPDENGERGVIINTSSISGFEGQIGAVSYSAAKAGIAGMTLPLAREFSRHGIRVMAIAPGLFETPMVADLRESEVEKMTAGVPFPHRLGQPKEYARLARDIVENSMLNGETIRLDAAFRIGGL